MGHRRGQRLIGAAAVFDAAGDGWCAGEDPYEGCTAGTGCGHDVGRSVAIDIADPDIHTATEDLSVRREIERRFPTPGVEHLHATRAPFRGADGDDPGRRPNLGSA